MYLHANKQKNQNKTLVQTKTKNLSNKITHTQNLNITITKENIISNQIFLQKVVLDLQRL